MNVKAKIKSLLAKVPSIVPVLLIISAFTAISLSHLLSAQIMEDRAIVGSAPALGSEPWTDAETVKPADLVKEMAGAKDSNRPVIVCTGFRFLYEGAHVPGAVFHGPASRPEGMGELKKWAQGIDRSSNVIIYCGCCPFENCPNVRPAFETLHSMGFNHLRVLLLPNNFAKDWVDQGYPSEKGK
ncbi:MAG: hypothetical protein WCA38_11790 [Candidatus Acidiferrales bacterium]